MPKRKPTHPAPKAKRTPRIIGSRLAVALASMQPPRLRQTFADAVDMWLNSKP